MNSNIHKFRGNIIAKERSIEHLSEVGFSVVWSCILLFLDRTITCLKHVQIRDDVLLWKIMNVMFPASVEDAVSFQRDSQDSRVSSRVAKVTVVTSVTEIKLIEWQAHARNPRQILSLTHPATTQARKIIMKRHSTWFVQLMFKWKWKVLHSRNIRREHNLTWVTTIFAKTRTTHART